VLLLWRVRLNPGPGHWLATIFVAYAAVSLTWSASPYDTMGELLHLLFLGMVFLLAAEETSLAPCIIGLAIGVSVSVPFSIAQMLGYSPVYVAMPTLPLAVGLFVNKAHLAEVGVLALIGVLGTIVARRAWWWALIPGPLLATILPESRETILVLGIVAAAWAWHIAPRARVLWVPGCAVATAAILCVAFMQPGGTGTVFDRFEYWRITASHLTWFGYGFGTFAALIPELESVHNEPLQFVFELGVGAVLLAPLVVYALWARAGVERLLLVAIIAQGLVWYPLHVPTTAFLFAVLAGFLVGVHNRNRRLESGRGAGRLHDATYGWPVVPTAL